MEGRPWWLRFNGVPPSSVRARERGQRRAARALTRKEIRWRRAVIALYLVYLGCTVWFVADGPPRRLFNLLPEAVILLIFAEWPAHHRRQTLGLRPKPGDPRPDHS